MPRRESISRNYAEADHLLGIVCDQLRQLHGEIDENRIRQAYELAQAAHEGQLRRDGSPFVMHPLEVAEICADLNMDEDSIIAALLHDTVEDTAVRLTQIRQLFGGDVAGMVDNLTKITKIDLLARFTGRGKASDQARNLQKLFVAMSRDIRVIVIKLADRLHNMQTLGVFPDHKRQRISLETYEFYIPIARRLGLGQMVRELDDLVFQHLYPEESAKLQTALTPTFELYEHRLEPVIENVTALLAANGIKARRIFGRRKHLFSIFRKMRKYGFSLEELDTKIYDLLAIRIIIEGNPMDCYSTLGLIHMQYRPIFERFRDFIAYPKDNGYQTLHTTVINDEGIRIECQIRTAEMDQLASKGVAAHWYYKESVDRRGVLVKDDSWNEFIRELSRERLDSEDFVARTRETFLGSQVLVLSPMGEVVSLPSGSTPIDFAYYIHTNLGHAIRGAKVNGAVVPLDHQLRNGDVIEVLKGEEDDTAPRPESLTMVKSPKSLIKIRQYFKRKPRSVRVAAGQAVLRQFIVREGLYPLNLTANEKLAELMRRVPVRSIDEIYEKVALGRFHCDEIVAQLKAIHTKRVELREDEAVALGGITPDSIDVSLIGIGSDLSVRLANGQSLRRRSELMRCCTPVSGDRIYGVFDRDSRRVKIHRVDCPLLQEELEDGELISLAWSETKDGMRFPARIEIVSLNRVGLLFEVLRYLSTSNINLGGAEFAQAPTVIGSDRYAHFQLTIEVADVDELKECLAELATLKDVREVKRLFKVLSNSEEGA